MDEKLKHFEVILESVEKIRKELDDLKGYINLQIHEARGQEMGQFQDDEFENSAQDIPFEMEFNEIMVKNEVVDDSVSNYEDQFNPSDMYDRPQNSDHRQHSKLKRKSLSKSKQKPKMSSQIKRRQKRAITGSEPEPELQPNKAKKHFEHQFIESTRGRALLVLEGSYIYSKNGERGPMSYWRCLIKNCPSKANINIINNDFVTTSKEHNHHPDRADVLKRIHINNLKLKSKTTQDPPSQIISSVDQVVAQSQLPSKTALKRAIQRARKKELTKKLSNPM